MLSGHKTRGVLWLVAILVLPIAGLFLTGIDTVPAIIVCAVMVVSALAWLAMLVDSCRPIPPLRWYGWLGVLLIAVIVRLASERAVLITGRTYRVPTAGMAPTIQAQDWVLGARWPYWMNEPRRGDIVAFDTSAIRNRQWLGNGDSLYAKRVVAVAGDSLFVRNGYLWVNGEPVPSPAPGIGYSPGPRSNFLNSEGSQFVVPPGEVFLLGDNTSNSLDSRYFGSVPVRSVIARLTIVYWPLARFRRIK